MTTEKRGPETRHERQPMQIARAVCVAPIVFTDLANKLQAGVPIANISFSEALLIRKSDKSQPSRNLVMPIGGEVDPIETRFQGMLREVAEETTFISISEKDSPERRHHPSFVFTIPGEKYKDEPRDVELIVHPVQSSSFYLQIPREGFHGDEDKISDVVSLSPAELRKLVQDGSLGRGTNTVKAAGHFTMNDDVTITISEEDKRRRNTALEGVLDDVDAFEIQLRTATLTMVNKLRRKKRENEVESLADALPGEITTAFVAAQMRMALGDERERERRGAELPPPKADLLKVLPYLAVVPPDMVPDLLLMAPTQEIVNNLLLLEDGLVRCSDLLFPQLGIDHDTRLKLDGLSPVEALRLVWPYINRLPLINRDHFMSVAERQMIISIAKDKDDLTEEDVVSAIDIMEHFHDFVTEELGKQKENKLSEGERQEKAQEPGGQEEKEVEIFQEYRPQNEILNAGLFRHLVYALGLYPDVDYQGTDTTTLKILRFEAMRNLAVFAAGLEAAKLLKGADNHLFQSTLNTFFEFPPSREQMVLGEGDFVHNVYRRKDKGTGLDWLIDERVKKRPESATRKIFQAKPNEMYDIFNMNFVLANDNFEGTADPVEARLQAAIDFRENLLGHIKHELGLPLDSEQVSIVPGTHKTASYDRARQAQGTGRQTEYGGARTGSKGDAIIRDKFVLCIDKGDGKPQYIEICIYPFQTTHTDELTELKDAGMWGFAEKVYDDDYSSRRLLQRNKSNPTEPSLYELLYQGVLYKFLSERMRRRHILARKAQIEAT